MFIKSRKSLLLCLVLVLCCVLAFGCKKKSDGNGNQEPPPPVVIELPFEEDFETEYGNFWLASYKSLPGDETAPMYHCHSGGSKMSLVDGVFYIGDSRFSIGEKAPYTETTAEDTAANGCFDLSKPYKISFKIVSIEYEEDGKKLQVNIDNNTTGDSNSIHGKASRVFNKKVDEELTEGQLVEIEPEIGTETSFIFLRVESKAKVGIDDFKVEYLD